MSDTRRTGLWSRLREGRLARIAGLGGIGRPLLILPRGPASERAFKIAGFLSVALPLALLAVLLVTTLVKGLPRLDLDFLTGLPSGRPQLAGVGPALAGTAMLMGLTAFLAIPIGIGAALYLEEYAKPGFGTNLIELTISTLAGVPSIIYALLGLEVFVRVMGFGRSLIAGAATLAILVLPMIIMASREALRTVPRTLREAAWGLGGDRFVTLRKVVLPQALPGIMTGVILALARAIGETAPLITIGAAGYIASAPDSLTSPFTSLPTQAFNWISRPQAGFHVAAAAAIIVLLVLMLVLNTTAIVLRRRMRRRITA